MIQRIVGLVQPYTHTYSETFVRAHIERLPARVIHLHGDWFPLYVGDERRLLPLPLFLLWKGLLSFGLPRRTLQHHTASTIARLIGTLGLARFLRAQRVDAILAEYGVTGTAVMDACGRARIPLVVHFHGFDAYEHTILHEYGAAYRRLFSVAAALIAVSRDMEQQLMRLGAPRERIHYNPCGVDAMQFGGANPTTAPPLFVAVGRFVDKKGPHLTLLAFQRTLQVYPSARLVMIGDGTLWEACQQMAQALGIIDAVTFTGPLPHSEIAVWMQQARAFVQHSVRTGTGDSEGTPVAVLEAGASGLPVVSTRHAGICDVVVPDQTGFLVEERDIEGMARAMLQLAADAALAGVMGVNACEHIRANFSMERSIARLWHIIEGVMDAP